MGDKKAVLKVAAKQQLEEVTKEIFKKSESLNKLATKLYEQGVRDFSKSKKLLQQNKEMDKLIIKEYELKNMLKEMEY